LGSCCALQVLVGRRGGQGTVHCPHLGRNSLQVFMWGKAGLWVEQNGLWVGRSNLWVG